jgi:hypothetical protein
LLEIRCVEANRERLNVLFDQTVDLTEDAFQARKIFSG